MVAGGWNPELESAVKAAALAAGFHLAGIASAQGDDDRVALDGERFEAWVDAGRAGEMEYLKRRDSEGSLLRSSVQVAIPWARSVVVCALNYEMDWNLPRSIDPAADGAGWIGRYAWSGKRQGQGKREEGEGISQERAVGEQGPDLIATDYHDELLVRLRLVEARLKENIACETRCYVDTGPIVERGLAAAAGVGWIGKNTCVINQQMGSWLLLGVIVTSLPMAELARLAVPDRCGSCTRCIDACPTDALVAPREMDASRCIAYLTIEKKGTIARELREGMERQVFGCDICQDVCPWNRKNGPGRLGSGRARPGMEPRGELVNPSLEWLAGMDSTEFRRWFKGSPLERTGRKRLHRNVAIAMGNSGVAEFLPRLEAWADGEDEVLAEAAKWAIGQIRNGESESG